MNACTNVTLGSALAARDLELLALCLTAEQADQAADAALHRARTMPEGSPCLAELTTALCYIRAREDAVERATYLPARTPEGLRAKAALLVTMIGLGLDPTMLATSLARDVAEAA